MKVLIVAVLVFISGGLTYATPNTNGYRFTSMELVTEEGNQFFELTYYYGDSRSFRFIRAPEVSGPYQPHAPGEVVKTTFPEPDHICWKVSVEALATPARFFKVEHLDLNQESSAEDAPAAPQSQPSSVESEKIVCVLNIDVVMDQELTIDLSKITTVSECLDIYNKADEGDLKKQAFDRIDQLLSIELEQAISSDMCWNIYNTALEDSSVKNRAFEKALDLNTMTPES